MLCEKCGKNQAVVRIVKIINGKKSQAMLCEECARELSNASLSLTFDNNRSLAPGTTNTANSTLEEILSKITNNDKIEVICKNCGTKYSEYKRTKKLGCSECYESFSESLVKEIKEIQQGVEHVGKVPVKEKGMIFKTKQVKKLKEELQKAIIEEEYEKAAILRDQIKEYESVEESEKNDY